MTEISDYICNTDNSTFHGDSPVIKVGGDDLSKSLGVLEDAISYFKCKVETTAAVFKDFHNSQALLTVGESSRDYFIECSLSCMSKGCMTKVMSEGNGLGEILIKFESPGDSSCYFRDFKCMSKSSSVVVSHWGEEDLSFMFESSECLGIDYPVPVSLKFCTHVAWLAWIFSAAALTAQTCVSAQYKAFPFFKLLSDAEGGFRGEYNMICMRVPVHNIKFIYVITEKIKHHIVELSEFN